MTPTCEVQWIDCQGNETTHYTPEPAVAIAVLRSDPSKRLFVCAAHAETATSHKAHHGDCPHVGTRTTWDVLPLVDTSPAPSPRVQVSHVTGDIRHMGASRRWVLQEIRANGARSVLSNWEGTDEEAFDAVLADPREVFCSCPCVKNPDGSCSGELQG